MRVLRGLGRYLAGTVLIVLFVVVGVGLRVVQTGSRNDRGPVDAIVVLGAAQYNGRPSPVYAARLDHAAVLFRAGVAQHVVTIGGGQQGDRLTEGEAGRRYLIEAGIPDAELMAVGTGNDTLVSLRATAAALRQHNWRSIVLVTDAWHSERSRLMATDLGVTASVSPVTDGPSSVGGVEGRYVARETLGTLFYLLTGGSSGAGSAVL